MTLTITTAPHPLLRPHAFLTRLPEGAVDGPSPTWLVRLLGADADADAPLRRDDARRTHVRDALRTHGYKPTGRGKPASEYLARAAREGGLRSINLPVDACNAVSLHSGFPISVIDLDRAVPPFRIAVAGQDEAYVFNPSGQEMKLAGLPCLFDGAGPCANAVKDSQRTKTDASTRRTLSVLWGCHPDEDDAAEAVRWYRDLLERADAETETVGIAPGD